MRNVKIGDLMKVTKGDATEDGYAPIRKGDVMRVTGIYPHIIMTEKTKGSRIRRCYPRKSWWLNLEKI